MSTTHFSSFSSSGRIVSTCIPSFIFTHAWCHFTVNLKQFRNSSEELMKTLIWIVQCWFLFFLVTKLISTYFNFCLQPSTSSATSDEKVDYVQVDKEKTQALQNTMQEWTDVRQSSEPTKGIKSWQSANMQILAAKWNTQCTCASLSLHFPSDWCAMTWGIYLP